MSLTISLTTLWRTLQKKGSKAAFKKRSLRPQKRGYRLLAAFLMAALQENVFLVTKKFVTKNPDFRH